MSTENKKAILSFYSNSIYPEISQQDRSHNSFIASGLKRNDRILHIKHNPIGFKFFSWPNIDYLTNALKAYRYNQDFGYFLQEVMLRYQQTYASDKVVDYRDLARVQGAVDKLNALTLKDMVMRLKLKNKRRTYYRKYRVQPMPVGNFKKPTAVSGKNAGLMYNRESFKKLKGKETAQPFVSFSNREFGRSKPKTQLFQFNQMEI